MSAQKTVLILGNSSAGLYDFRNELIQELLKEYRVIASLPDTVKTDLLKEEGVIVEETPLSRRGVNPFQDFRLLLAYRKLLKKYRPDLVLTYTIKPNCYGGMACRLAKVPYIATVTGLGSTFQKEGLLLTLVQTLYRIGLGNCACVFFQNEENRQVFHEAGLVSGRERLVSGSGVNVDYWKALPYPEHEETRFLFVGRLMKEKGIEEYFRAAETLHTDHIIFEICGYCDEDYQEELDRLTEEGAIEYLGFHPDMRPYYANCDAVVLPTYHEGMSNVLMEASACARPVLASNISGCREIVDHTHTGYTFTPRSDEELTRTIRRFLLQNRSFHAKMGLAAREKMVREFDRRRVAAAYMEEIHRILNG